MVITWEPENYFPDLSALSVGLTVLMQHRFHVLTDEQKLLFIFLLKLLRCAVCEGI